MIGRFPFRDARLPSALGSLILLVSCCPCQSSVPAPCVASSPASAPAKPAATVTAVERIVEDFESPAGRSGGFWFEFDKNPLGTVANPKPFVLGKEGSPKSPGGAAHIWGTLGANRAPWSWVQLQVFLNRSKKPEDLSAFASVRFHVKGDGGRYAITLVRKSVTDYDHFRYEFTAPKEWTEMQIPLSSFHQLGWGKPVAFGLNDVEFIQLSPTAAEQPFDVWFDDIVLSPTVVVDKPFAYDTKNWFPYQGFDPKQRSGTALDMSRLLDAPAGKHGPLGKQGERFVFRDGKEARFFGVNIVASANFPTHEEADKIALTLSQMGVNITRHHHMDAPWSTPNVFGNGPSTLELDPTAMERFDYLIAQLQKRGIYQFFDMLVHRKVTDKDGVPNADKLAAGLKIEGEFDPKLIELEERFITQFMERKNAHTGRIYAKDPAVVLVEGINEDSLFWLTPDGEFSVKTAEGHAELNRQFSSWLVKQGVKDRATLEKRWAGSGKGLDASEDPAKGNVVAFVATGKAAEKELSPARARDVLHFYYEVTRGYHQRLEKHLRKLGFQGLYTGSNHWTEHPLDLAVNAEFGFVDRHAYWAHPSGGWGYLPTVTWDNSPMVKDPELGIIGSLGRRRVKGLPYSTSEWQSAAPNDYRHEGLLLVGAYASLQGFSPIQFAYSHDIAKKVDAIETLSGNFDVIEQPTQLGAWPAVAALFHRGDVRPSDVNAYVGFDRATGYEPAATMTPPKQLSLIARTGIDFGPGQPADALAALRAKYIQGTKVTSTTGELRHDSSAGRFEIDTPRTQGVITFTTDKPVVLGQTQFELTNAFGVLIVTSLTNEPIASSKRLLVTALGNAVNTDMKLTSNRSGFNNVGHSPVLVEPLSGKIGIALGKNEPAMAVHCYPLAASGARKTEIPVTVEGGKLTLALDAAHQTMHYEIVR